MVQAAGGGRAPVHGERGGAGAPDPGRRLPGRCREGAVADARVAHHRQHRRSSGPPPPGERGAAFFDGALLDNIVDYITYVFAPMVLLWSGGYLPAGTSGVVFAALPLLASSY